MSEMVSGLAILGSTGTIGVNTLDVVSRNPERFTVVTLTANRDVERMTAQCLQWRPKLAVMADENAAEALHAALLNEAPEIRHKGLPPIAREALCRTCHVIEPGKVVADYVPEPTLFAPNAFPPLTPNNEDHREAWGTRNCMMCHEDGIRDAPLVRHEGMPKILLEAKCRTCHVQVRSHETSPFGR